MSTNEERARWIFNNLLEDGQLACSITTDKTGMAFNRLIDHEEDGFWLDICRKHVNHEQFMAEVISVKGSIYSRSSDSLGIYFGGARVQNMTRSVGIDYDEPDAAEALAEYMEKLPWMQFFQKPSGLWHAHGGLSEKVHATQAKDWMRSLVIGLRNGGAVEVFPKVHDAKKLNGNMMRLPFGAGGYEPVNGLEPLFRQNSSLVLEFAPRVMEATSTRHEPNHTPVPIPHPVPFDVESPLASRCLDFVRESKLWHHQQGLYVPGRNNSQSEFDWRFLSSAVRNGMTNRDCLDWLIQWRNESKRGPGHSSYRSTTIDNVLNSVSKPVKPSAPLPNEAIYSWLYTALFFKRLGSNCRDCYYACRRFVKQAHETWTGEEGTTSPVTRIYVSSLADYMVLTTKTTRRALNSLRVLGLVVKTKNGIQVRTPTEEEQPRLETIGATIRQRRGWTRNEEGTKKLMDMTSNWKEGNRST